ncbi:MAG: GNAT family N-acetyltransferase [Deltaproteobacteria bacterium]|nr:GNAT family N-acetyltransferase [Deltaproteobacteria bacterium]
MRIARMEPADAARLVPVHLKAFAGYLNVRLGPSYVLRFLQWFCSEPSAIALVATSGALPVGYVVGAPADYGRRMSMALAPAVAAAVAMRPWLLVSRRFRNALVGRIRAVGKRLPAASVGGSESSPARVSLVGVGVAPEVRRSGVGSGLMREFEKEAARRGFDGIRLTVYAANGGARRFYERHGWVASANGAGETVEYTKVLKQPL